MRYISAILVAFALAGCNDSLVAPTPPPPAPSLLPALELRGAVTFFDLQQVGNPGFLNVVYTVTTFSNRNLERCWVTVKWLSWDDKEIAFDYVRGDATIPQGYSELRSADWHEKRIAELIRNSRVEYECFGEEGE